jgi:signal transduction histidine kinase
MTGPGSFRFAPTRDPAPRKESAGLLRLDPAKGSGLFPSMFVVVSLLVLLIVPLVVQQRVDTLRSQVEEIAEPARFRLNEVQYLLSREASTLQIFLATRNAAYLTEYREFAQRETEVYPELQAFAAELEPEALAAVVELRTRSEQWHERVAQNVIAPATAATEGAEIVLELDLYLRALEAGNRADAVLAGATQLRRQAIRRVEGFASLIYGLLTLLALGAATVIARLNARIGRLAADADSRRREVEWAFEETARAVEARAYLIRGFTHDVKNPLGAANGFAELLRLGVRGDLTDDQRETVDRIQSAIRSAVAIIDELLELSHLESGGLRVTRKRVDLDDLLRDLRREHAPAAAALGLDLQYASGHAGDTVVFTDPDRVRQVLGNLISNALKYTPPPGRITLGLADENRTTPPHEGRWLAVAVEDTGYGIPLEEQERIFDEFHRVPGAPGKGHGLGLAISRRIARLLGGDVTVYSTLGSGSVFFLWLPVRDGAVEP